MSTINTNQLELITGFGIIIGIIIMIIPIIILLIFLINTIEQTKLLKEISNQQKYTNRLLEDISLGR